MIKIDNGWSWNWKDSTFHHESGQRSDSNSKYVSRRQFTDFFGLRRGNHHGRRTITINYGGYCKRIGEGKISKRFVSENPINFDIENSMLSGLRDNSFYKNTIRDPWEHLARFYETTSLCRPTNVTEDQVKLRLFSFSLIGRPKFWLLCLPNGTIRTWKELEDKFFERCFTTHQFSKLRVEITNFEQQKTKLFYDSWERFKLLLRRCPNHNMNNMKQMHNFIKGLKVKHTCF